MLCLGSLLLGFYLISNILPFPGYIDEVFITALAFPFFNRKLRVRVTTAVQGGGFLSFVRQYFMTYMKYGDLVIMAVKNKLETGTIYARPEVNLIPESVSKVGSNLVQSMGIFDQFFLFFKAFAVNLSSASLAFSFSIATVSFSMFSRSSIILTNR